MAKAKKTWAFASIVDGLCAATGWNRYYATGYLVVWQHATQLAGIETVNATHMQHTFPGQTDDPRVEPKRLLEILVKLGAITHDIEGFTIAGNPVPKQKKSQQAIEKTCNHWSAYALAYEGRHGKKPLRDAKQNAIMRRIEATIPCCDMDEFLHFYVRHDDYRFTVDMHPLWQAERHANALHTQMKTGRVMMSGKARQDAKANETKQQMSRILNGDI